MRGGVAHSTDGADLLVCKKQCSQCVAILAVFVQATRLCPHAQYRLTASCHSLRQFNMILKRGILIGCRNMEPV